MLDDRVVLERVHAQVLAVAGLLEAAVGHLGDERDVVVDPHAAEAQRLGDAQRAADVARPHRGGEAVAGRVGPRDRLLLVAEALHGDDRAEDLALDHLVVLLAGRPRRSARGRSRAASGSPPPVTTSACSGRRSRKPSTRSRWRAELTGPSVVSADERVADHEALRLLGEARDDVVVDAARRRARGSPRCSPGRRCSSRCRRSSRARSRGSTSSNTTTGALPPSSRCTRLSVSAAVRAMCLPVSTEPVSETMSTSGCVEQRLPGRAPGPGDHVEHALAGGSRRPARRGARS